LQEVKDRQNRNNLQEVFVAIGGLRVSGWSDVNSKFNANAFVDSIISVKI
jgi:hypothetical protein